MITKSEAKYIQSLGHKKFRDEQQQFVAEGPKIVNELATALPNTIKAIYATPEWWLQQSALHAQLAPGQAIEVNDAELQRISFLTTPNQVLGIFRQPDFPAAISLKNRLSLMLDGIQDPGNMGTLIRIADWFGIQHIIASSESADAYNPKVVQATMGSIARVQVLYKDLPAFLQEQADIPVYAATLEGQPLTAAGKIKEGIILVGNESKGISEALIERAQHKITIPRTGAAESLNAAVAAGIILSHLN